MVKQLSLKCMKWIDPIDYDKNNKLQCPNLQRACLLIPYLILWRKSDV
jgi:hypothetical protein